MVLHQEPDVLSRAVIIVRLKAMVGSIVVIVVYQIDVILLRALLLLLLLLLTCR